MKPRQIGAVALLSAVLASCGQQDTKEADRPAIAKRSVKIRVLTAPDSDLSSFDPGEYLGSLEFYETSDPISEKDRDELAQFVHLLAFMALRAKSSAWANSVVARDTLAYRALESHFGHLDGWGQLAQNEGGLPYRQLAAFLFRHYPPRAPNE